MILRSCHCTSYDFCRSDQWLYIVSNPGDCLNAGIDSYFVPRYTVVGFTTGVFLRTNRRCTESRNRSYFAGRGTLYVLRCIIFPGSARSICCLHSDLLTQSCICWPVGAVLRCLCPPPPPPLNVQSGCLCQMKSHARNPFRTWQLPPSPMTQHSTTQHSTASTEGRGGGGGDEDAVLLSSYCGWLG